MSIADRYQRVMGRTPSPETARRLSGLQETLDLRENDALWTVVLTLENYNELFRHYPEQFHGLVRQQLRVRETSWVPLATCGIVYTILVGATGICLGANLAQAHAPLVTADSHPLWQVVMRIVSAPAGWTVVFVGCLPLALNARSAVDVLRNRRAERNRRVRAAATLTAISLALGCWLLCIIQ